MPIRVGFICGKDTDFVEHPGTGPKYSEIGNVAFLKDMPDKWRVDPGSHEYLMDCEPGTRGQAHVDVALAWYIKKNFSDIEVDIITPEDFSLQRLLSNDVNFIVGWNAVSIAISNSSKAAMWMRAFKKAPNLCPTWEQEDFIFTKSKYMKACIAAGVPMAPTIFAKKGSRSPAKLLKEIRERGWRRFVMKQSESGFCLGFLKLSVADCEKNPKVLEEYFQDFAHCPEFIVQEMIEGFTRNWETRCFWWNGKFLYAIANMAAVSTKDQKEKIIAGDDIPAEFLENAKRIGRAAIKNMPPMVVNGKSVKNVLLRTDIGCSDSMVYDRNTKWNPNKRTFFLNEIEPSSTTYFARWLKFDCIPLYGKLYAQLAREIHKNMKGSCTKQSKSLPAKLSMRGKAASGLVKKKNMKAKAPKAKAAKVKGTRATGMKAMDRVARSRKA